MLVASRRAVSQKMLQQIAVARGFRRRQQTIKHHAFLTHDWGIDSHGRDNHVRVAASVPARRPER